MNPRSSVSSLDAFEAFAVAAEEKYESLCREGYLKFGGKSTFAFYEPCLH
jgi:hypothetical protein